MRSGGQLGRAAACRATCLVVAHEVAFIIAHLSIHAGNNSGRRGYAAWGKLAFLGGLEIS